MYPLMNDTKWDELRLAMFGLGELSPLWRTKDINGYDCPWDGEWFYRFRIGGYSTIEWVEIQVSTDEQVPSVFDILHKIHLPGHRVEGGFRVYGYAPQGLAEAYL